MNRQIEPAEREPYVAYLRQINRDCPPRFYIYTFGCQQNEADSERLRGMAADMGYLPADTPEEARLILVNTCAIRAHAENKVLSLLGRLKYIKESYPDTVIGVVGCMAAEPGTVEALRRSFPYVDFTLQPNLMHRLYALVAQARQGAPRTFVLGEDSGEVVEGLPVRRTAVHRAWVSVMYGCNNFCSYCIVPYVRGRERSRDSETVLSECRELVASGCREITLLGQNVNSYRSDTDFAGLLSRVCEIPGDFIVRFMTSHPKDVSGKLIEVMAAHPDRIPPYFHLPLQSGSDRILRQMNRTYDTARYLSIVERLRERVPGVALSTDIIVGFPGEEEEDFAATLDILRRVGFDAVYSFLYSPRAGTRAAEMENRVPRDVMGGRMSRLLAAQDEISLSRNRAYEGRICRVLVDSVAEEGEETVCTARTMTNKIVHFPAGRARVGDFAEVKIERAAPYCLYGKEI